MISKIIQDREWKLKLSFLDRKCYFSGESLKYKLCYVGTKKIHNIVNNQYTNDSIYITQKEYFKILKKNLV
jgi:hypothetical protein